MAEFRPLIVGLLLAGLFAFALINGAIQLADVNHANQSIADDPTMSSFKTALEENLSDAYSKADNASTAFSSSPVTLSASSIFFDALGGIWRTMKVVPVAIYNLTIGLLMTKIFGSEQFGIVFGVIGAILIITIILGVWKMISSGESG